jgi:hypothetical protein
MEIVAELNPTPYSADGHLQHFREETEPTNFQKQPETSKIPHREKKDYAVLARKEE